MAGEYSQTSRQIAVTTPLGDDVLLLRSARITERLSTLFECELELLSEDLDISPDSLLGQPMTVRLHVQDESERFFNGLVCSFIHRGFEGRLAVYQAILRHWLWLLTRTSDCRIFPFPRRCRWQPVYLVGVSARGSKP